MSSGTSAGLIQVRRHTVLADAKRSESVDMPAGGRHRARAGGKRARREGEP
jgi:hypothetical protein